MSARVENINKFYGKQQVLNNICFETNVGEIVGLLGPNGAGKSTIMKIITGFVAPNSGKALVNNMDVEYNKQKVCKNIGYLPENNPLYYDMYVREYLNMSGKIQGMHKGLKQRIEDIITDTGLTKEAHKKAGQLSKGYKQRLGLAAAMLHNPDTLILDEPTTGLDPNQILEIRTLIKNISKEKTVIISTHIMQEVEAICSRAIIINKGKIIADKPIAALKKQTLKPMQQVEIELTEESDVSIFGETGFCHIEEIISSKKIVVESEINEDIRAKIFKLATSKNAVIITLKEKEQQLEEIFRNITN